MLSVLKKQSQRFAAIEVVIVLAWFPWRHYHVIKSMYTRGLNLRNWPRSSECKSPAGISHRTLGNNSPNTSILYVLGSSLSNAHMLKCFW